MDSLNVPQVHIDWSKEYGSEPATLYAAGYEWLYADLVRNDDDLVCVCVSLENIFVQTYICISSFLFGSIFTGLQHSIAAE